MRSKFGFLILALILFVSVTSEAYAYEMEYYTYNGFDPIVSSFQKIALIFGDNGYKALFFSIIAMSIFFGGAAFYFRMATGAKGGGLSWTIPVITGVVLWAGLVLPKGTLHVYDPVLNRYQAVGSIPDGLVVLAGSLNVVEKGLVDIIQTSGDPKSYQNAAGGIGFNALLKATGVDLMPNDTYLDDSLKKFTIDCIFFELQRPGTALSVNDITNNSVDFFAQYSQAVNPAVYTTYYQDSNNTCPSGPGNWKNGCTMTCTEAWARIQTDFGTPANFTKARNSACAAAGFNPQNAAEMQRCDNLINQYVLYTSGNAINIPSTTYLRQAYMAQNLNNTLLSVNPDLAMTTLANRNAVVSNIGTGIMANEWLPIARAVVTSVALGLVPFLVLFIPTPLFGKAIGTIAGFFVWLTAWGVTDAITHGIATDNAYKIFESVRANDLGFAAMMATPDTAMKTLSMFGMMRTFGIMLATVLSGMLVKFGGHALAMMAGNISGHIQASGASAAMATQTPEGHANTMRQNWDVMPTETWANKYSWQQMTQSKMFEQGSRIESNLQTMNALGGGPMGAAQRMGETSAFNTLTGVATVGGLKRADYTSDTIADMNVASTRQRYGDIAALKRASGGDIEGFSKAASTMNYARTAEILSRFAKDNNISLDEAAQRVGSLTGDRETLGIQAFGSTRDVVGRDALLNAEINKGLNEAAKFEQTYQFAHALGYAGSRNDFEGMYKGHLAHHAQESWTLQDQASVDHLNSQMSDQGLKTRFQVGDRVSMAMADGRITLAKGDRGASSEALDLTSVNKGYRYSDKNVRDTRNINLSGSERDSSVVEKSGRFRQIYDNFTSRMGGEHSVTYNDFKESYSGLRDMGFNVRTVEDASIAGGYRMMIQDPKTGAVVAGDIKNVVTAYRQTADGATQEVQSAATGDVLYSHSQFGNLRDQFQNQLRVHMGVTADGTATEGIRKVAGETAAVGAAGVVDGVGTIGKTVGGFKKILEISPKGNPNSGMKWDGPASQWPPKWEDHPVPPSLPTMMGNIRR